MTIEKYTYTEGNVTLDVQFNGKAFINATEAYKAFGKDKSTFGKWKKRNLIKYAQRLIDLGKIGGQNVNLEFLIDIKGDEFPVQERGTWIHPKLAIMFARWLSMDFEIWCDEKIEVLLQKGYVGVNEEIQSELDKLAKQSNVITSYIKEKGKLRAPMIIDLYETIDGSILSMEYCKKVLSEITSAASSGNIRRIYEKLLKELTNAFKDDKISRETRDGIRNYLNTYYVALLKRRLTKAMEGASVGVKVNEYLDEISSLKTLIDTHEQRSKRQIDRISSLNLSIKSKDLQLEQFQEDLEDPRPIKFDLRVTNMVQDVINGLKDINDNDFVVIFNGILAENQQKTMKKHPDWRGDSLTASGRQTGAGMWENDGYYYLNIALNMPPYAALCKVELYQSSSNEDVYVGTDNVKRHFATFNNKTGNLIVYRKK